MSDRIADYIRDEIQAIPPGGDLDALIARMLGCNPEQVSKGYWLCPCPTTDCVSPHGTIYDHHYSLDLRRYSSNLEAARDVIDHLCTFDDNVTCHLTIDPGTKGVYFCRFEKHDEPFRPRDISGSDLAHAICLAAIVFQKRIA